MLECLKRAWRLCGQTDSCCGYLCPCLRFPSSGAVTSQAGNAWKVHSPGPCSPTPAPPAHTSAGTVQGQLVKSLLGQGMGQQGIQQGVQASTLQRQPIRAVINSVVHCDSSTAAATPPDCIACTAHQYQKQRPEAAKSACFLQHQSEWQSPQCQHHMAQQKVLKEGAVDDHLCSGVLLVIHAWQQQSSGASAQFNLHQAQQLEMADALDKSISHSSSLAACLLNKIQQSMTEELHLWENIAQRRPWTTYSAGCGSAAPISKELLARAVPPRQRVVCSRAGPQQGLVEGQHLDTQVSNEGAQHATQARDKITAQQGQHSSESCTLVLHSQHRKSGGQVSQQGTMVHDAGSNLLDATC